MQVTHSDYLVKFLDPATPHGAQVRLGLIYKSACGGGGSTYYEKKRHNQQGQLLAESALSLHSQGPVLHNSVLY